MLRKLTIRLRRVSFPGWVLSAVVIALLLGAVALLRTGTSQPIRPITIGSGPWSPFVGEGLDGHGPMGLLVTQVLERQGYEVAIDFRDWGETEVATARGELFGSFPFIVSEQRDQEFVFSDPLIEFDYALFFSAGHLDEPPQRVTDLVGMRIGLAGGYEPWPELAEAVDGFEPFTTVREAFDALAAGEVDVVVEGLLSGLAIIDSTESLRESGIQVVEAGARSDLGSVETLHFIMPRSDAAVEVIARFNEILAEIKVTDSYRAIAAALPSRVSTYVELVPAGPEGLVALLDGDAVIYTPHGTSARVIEWPDRFLVSGDPVSDDALVVTVQILDGPAVGRIVDVDVRSIRLVGGRP